MSTARAIGPLAFVSLGIAVAAVGAYHLAFGGGPPPTGPVATPSDEVAREVAALRRDVDRLAAGLGAAGSGLSGGGGSAPGSRIDALETRIAHLEGRGAPAPGGGPVPGVPPSGSAAGAWTEEQISAVSGMLAEIDVRKKREQNARRMKAVVRASGAHPTPEEEAAAVQALLSFQDQVEVLYKDGSAGTTPEARAATMARGRELRDALERTLRAALSAEAVAKILRSLPSFGAPPPQPPSTPKPGGAPLGPPSTEPKPAMEAGGK